MSWMPLSFILVVSVISCSVLQGACLFWFTLTMKLLLHISPTSMLYCWYNGFVDSWAPASLCICQWDINTYGNVHCRWRNLQKWVNFLLRISRHEVISSRNIYMCCINGLYFCTLTLHSKINNLLLDLLVIVKDKFFFVINTVHCRNFFCPELGTLNRSDLVITLLSKIRITLTNHILVCTQSLPALFHVTLSTYNFVVQCPKIMDHKEFVSRLLQIAK